MSGFSKTLSPTNIGFLYYSQFQFHVFWTCKGPSASQELIIYQPVSNDATNQSFYLNGDQFLSVETSDVDLGLSEYMYPPGQSSVFHDPQFLSGVKFLN